MKKTIFILALCLGIATSVQANPNSSNNKFTQMDKNTDGQVSLEEFNALYPNMQSRVFGMIDTNKDNYIDVDEWSKFQTDHMRGMKEHNEQNTKPSKSPGDAGGRGMDQGMPPVETHPGGTMLIMPPAGK